MKKIKNFAKFLVLAAVSIVFNACDFISSAKNSIKNKENGSELSVSEAYSQAFENLFDNFNGYEVTAKFYAGSATDNKEQIWVRGEAGNIFWSYGLTSGTGIAYKLEGDSYTVYSDSTSDGKLQLESEYSITPDEVEVAVGHTAEAYFKSERNYNRKDSYSGTPADWNSRPGLFGLILDGDGIEPYKKTENSTVAGRPCAHYEYALGDMSKAFYGGTVKDSYDIDQGTCFKTYWRSYDGIRMKEEWYTDTSYSNTEGQTFYYEVTSFKTGASVTPPALHEADKEFYSADSAGMVKIKGGTFSGTTTFTPESEVFIKGRSIKINDLYVCDHETTQSEYEKYCNYGGSSPDDLYGAGENYPAYKVNYYDAIVYCNLRSIAEGLTPCYSMAIDGAAVTDVSKWTDVAASGGKFCGPSAPSDSWNTVACDFTANGYRLPTEAEWEYCSRASESSFVQFTYSGSYEIDDVAWYYGNSSSKTREVKQKTANKIKLYDMSGNVKEWCYDWYENITADTAETGAESGFMRVCRGGSIATDKSYCEVGFRARTTPYLRYPDAGFRVVRTAE